LTSKPRSFASDPTFVKIIDYGDKVYLFFRETAKQLETGSSMVRSLKKQDDRTSHFFFDVKEE